MTENSHVATASGSVSGKAEADAGELINAAVSIVRILAVDYALPQQNWDGEPRALEPLGCYAVETRMDATAYSFSFFRQAAI